MSKATNIKLIEQSEYIDIYRIDYGVILRVVKCRRVGLCCNFNKRKNKRLANDCYKIINQEEEHCNVGDVILNNCIVEKVDDPKDYTYELKISGGELLGNAISMTWYTNRINEVIAKYIV